jgi:hypothetical protein
MGYVANYARTFRAEVVTDSTNAVEGTDFKLLDGVLKAGEYNSYLPVVIYRNAKIDTLQVKLIATDDLTPANPDDITFRVIWSSELVQPANWPTYFWGAYNVNMYRFAIEQLGETDWPQYSRFQTSQEDGYYTINDLLRRATQLNEAYAKYKETNGPIYNIDGDPGSGEIHFGS